MATAIIPAATALLRARSRDDGYSRATPLGGARPNIERLANLADSHGGAYPAVNPDVVLQTEINFAGRELLIAASAFLGPMREKIEQAKLENAALAETRDYLLPKLMSGEVRVRDAEMFAEGAPA